MSMEKKRERKRMIAEGRDFLSFTEERRIEKKKENYLGIAQNQTFGGWCVFLSTLPLCWSVCLSL